MGIWDFIKTTTDQVKQNAPDLTPVKDVCYNYSNFAVTKIDNAVRVNPLPRLRAMGIWDSINSTTNQVKQNLPDLTSVMEAYRTSSYAAFTKIGNGFQYLTADETRAMTGLFATKLAKNAADYAVYEGFKCIPGGVVFHQILFKSLSDVKSEKQKDQEINTVEAKMARPEKNSSGGRKLPDQEEMPKHDVELGSRNTLCLDPYANKKPEDVIRIFMMKEFMGARFLDDLMVPESRRRKKHE